MITTLQQIKDYYNTKPVEYVIKEKYELVEDNEYRSKTNLASIPELANIPINEPIKYTPDIAIKAIKYGMIFLIDYKGAEDKHFSGHSRAVAFVVAGRSAVGKPLLRAWHLSGWSVSNKRHIKKIWRLFRADRIMSITFTGSFIRLAPSGYNMNDKGMRGGIIAKADFNEIRKNQRNLIKQDKIQSRDEISMGDENRKFVTIKANNTNSELDLIKPMDNAYINNIKNVAIAKITFLKSLYGNNYIALSGAMGQPGNTIKLIDENNVTLGVFKVLDSIMGSSLKKIKTIKGNKIFKLYLFDKKL